MCCTCLFFAPVVIDVNAVVVVVVLVFVLYSRCISAHICLAHAKTHDFTHWLTDWLTAENLNSTRKPMQTKQTQKTKIKNNRYFVYITVKPKRCGEYMCSFLLLFIPFDFPVNVVVIHLLVCVFFLFALNATANYCMFSKRSKPKVNDDLSLFHVYLSVCVVHIVKARDFELSSAAMQWHNSLLCWFVSKLIYAIRVLALTYNTKK